MSVDGEVRGPRVVVLTGPDFGRVLRLGTQAVELGRGDASDLILAQAGVDDRHARLEPRAGGWIVLNQSDAGGLRVNDVEVREHALRSGDRIQLGEAILVFSDQQQELRAWLTSPTRVEDQDARMSGGFLCRLWSDLKASMRPGDELWRFSSPPESWRRLAGRAGLCVVRAGAVVYTVVTEMN